MPDQATGRSGCVPVRLASRTGRLGAETVVVIVLVPEPPCTTETEVGEAEIVKSGFDAVAVKLMPVTFAPFTVTLWFAGENVYPERLGRTV